MMFNQGAFVTTGNETPEQLQRKRELIASMMPRYGEAKYIGQGLGQLATGIASGVKSRKLDRAEAEKRQEAKDAFGQVFGSRQGGQSAPSGGFSILGFPKQDSQSGQERVYDALASGGGPTNKAAAALSGSGFSAMGPEYERAFRAISEGESGGDYTATEDHRYSPARAREIFPSAFGGMSDAQISGLVSQGPEAFFEAAYGANTDTGRRLGNINPGDGGLYRGRGPIQLTGRGNYERYAAMTGHDIVNNPDLITQDPQVASDVTRAYLADRVEQTGDPVGDVRAAVAGGRGTKGYGMNIEADRARYGGSAPGGQVAPSLPSYSGPSAAEISSLMANPWLTSQQRQQAQLMMTQALQAEDPLRQLQIQQAQRELSAPTPRDTQYIKGIGLIDTQTGQVIQDYPGAAGQGGTEYGLAPQYGVDENGNPVLIQIGKDGTATQTQLPPGVTFQKEPVRIDAGTEWVLLDPITRQPVGRISKNNAEAAAASARGTATGKAEAQSAITAPQVMERADSGIQLIDQIINDPALPSILGKFQGRMDPNELSGVFMSQDAINLVTKTEQLQGQTFMQAFESLKGGGQITEREGQAATQAIANLSRLQDPEAYRKSLGYLRQLLENAKLRAGGQDVAELLPDAATSPDFSQMTADDLLNMDLSTLDMAGMDAWEARMEELGQ